MEKGHGKEKNFSVPFCIPHRYFFPPTCFQPDWIWDVFEVNLLTCPRPNIFIPNTFVMIPFKAVIPMITTASNRKSIIKLVTTIPPSTYVVKKDIYIFFYSNGKALKMKGLPSNIKREGKRGINWHLYRSTTLS